MPSVDYALRSLAQLVLALLIIIAINRNKYIYLQVDRLEDELMSEQEKFKAITEELEQTFAEMSGY